MLNFVSPPSTGDSTSILSNNCEVDFLIIGAAKSATSWITRCLVEHPGVSIPSGEVHYFSWHYEGTRLPESYLANFRTTRPKCICGENSNTYLSHPKAAARIHESLPDIKLIVSLRNPIDRAYSDWAMRLRQRYQLKDLFRFLDPDRAPDLWFLHKGLYFQQLQPYLERYPTDRFHFLLMDDMKESPRDAWTAVCKFLSVDSSFVPEMLSKRVNTKDDPLLFPRFKDWVQKWRWGNSIINRSQKSVALPVLKKVLGRAPQAPPMQDEIREKLKDFYRDDVASLSEFLGRDLSHWVK